MIREYRQLLTQNRNYRNLFCALSISLLGDWLNLFALLVLLHEMNASSASIVGFVLIMKQLPQFFFAPVGGWLADRFSRRGIMYTSDIGRAIVVLGLLVAPHTDSLWPILALVTLQSTLSAFFEPARSALTPDIVPHDRLLVANSLGSIMWSVMLIVGSGVGGVLTEIFGWKTALVADACSYLLSAWFVTRIKNPSANLRSTDPRPSTREFLAFLRTRPDVLTFTMLKGLYAVGGAMHLILTLFGQRVFTAGSMGVLGLSVLYFARGAGALLGPQLANLFTTFQVRWLYRGMLAGLALIGLSYGLLGFTTTLPVAALLVATGHMGGSIVWVYSTSLVQITVPATMRGRAFGIELAGFNLTACVSTFGVGWLIDSGILSVHGASIAIGGYWCLLFLLLVWVGKALRRSLTAGFD